MEEAFKNVLDHYRARIAEEARRWAEAEPGALFASRDEFLLPVGEEVANLLVDLAVGLKAQTIVELGTSYGFSTLFLAEAARRMSGILITYEIDAKKQDYAKARIAEAGLSAHVEWRLGDAVQLLAAQQGPVDLVLMDLWKDLYVPCLDAIYPKLAPNGVIVADNMLFPEVSRPDAAAYRAAVRAKPDMQAVLLPIGQGIDIACKVAAP